MSHPVLANFLTAKEKYHKKVHTKKIVDKGHRLMSAFHLLAPFFGDFEFIFTRKKADFDRPLISSFFNDPLGSDWPYKNPWKRMIDTSFVK